MAKMHYLAYIPFPVKFNNFPTTTFLSILLHNKVSNPGMELIKHQTDHVQQY